jgi:signal transduction histidine kinase
VARAGRAGLRWKMVLALVVTSAATLAAAGAALAPPLEHRIASDRLAAMRALAGTAALSLRRLPAADLRPGSPRTARIVRALQRRTGARVALFDARGRAQLDTDPGRRDPASGILESLEDRGLARHRRLSETVRGDEAIVVTPVRTHAGPRTLVLRKPLGDSRAAAAVIRRALPLAGAAGLAIACILGLLLSFGLLRRLERLRQGARRLGDGGIAEPLPLDTARDEVGDLSRALETMRSRLEEEDRSRQAFLGTASHELRTPLALLQATVEMLDEALAAPQPDVESARRRAATAGRQTRRLAQLATDLLDLTRLDAHGELRTEATDVTEIARAMQAEFQAPARDAGVELRMEGASVLARADGMAVARILGVLLDNAIRYGAGGSVTTSVSRDGRQAVVHVRDTGPGLAVGEHARIFGRFERGMAGRQTRGFGLGLAIGRELARRMGGDLVAVPSERGACFALTLPLATGEPSRGASRLLPAAS